MYSREESVLAYGISGIPVKAVFHVAGFFDIEFSAVYLNASEVVWCTGMSDDSVGRSWTLWPKQN